MNMTAAYRDDPRPPVLQAGGITLVLGMGGTGVSCAQFLGARGTRGMFADSRPLPPGLAAIRVAMPGAEILPAGAPARVPAGVDRLVVSPGVDLHWPLFADARRLGLPILSDIDLFLTEAAAPITAITGSNGKSTVTSMLGAMLADAGWRCRWAAIWEPRRWPCLARGWSITFWNFPVFNWSAVPGAHRGGGGLEYHAGSSGRAR